MVSTFYTKTQMRTIQNESNKQFVFTSRKKKPKREKNQKKVYQSMK